jgi:hypothetical protein
MLNIFKIHKDIKVVPLQPVTTRHKIHRKEGIRLQ